MLELFEIIRNIITFYRVLKLMSELRVGHFFVKPCFAFFFFFFSDGFDFETGAPENGGSSN